MFIYMICVYNSVACYKRFCLNNIIIIFEEEWRSCWWWWWSTQYCSAQEHIFSLGNIFWLLFIWNMNIFYVSYICCECIMNSKNFILIQYSRVCTSTAQLSSWIYGRRYPHTILLNISASLELFPIIIYFVHVL